MKIERGLLEILFNDINPCYILDYLISEKRDNTMINFDMFYRSSMERFEVNSKDEIERVYMGVKNEIDYNDPRTFINYLGKFTSTLLVYNEYEPRIRYEKLMRWNKLSHLLGQDILTMSFLAYHDIKYHDTTNFFAYKATISTNNRQLHNILQAGIAENHFHLKGSAQVFCLNWLSLMNHPENRKKEFKNFNIKLTPHPKYKSYTDYSLYELIEIAAIIRMYFFLKISDSHEIIDDFYNLETFDKEIRSRNMSFILQEWINKFSIVKSNCDFQARTDLDYAYIKNDLFDNQSTNNIHVGERKILYTVFKISLSNQLTLLEARYLYLYLLIKSEFRRELIQVNKVFGFSNFSDYEQRKEVFLEKFNKYRNALIKTALDDTFKNQNIVSLEARITPKNKTLDNIAYIKNIDKLIDVKKNYKEKLFYVFHFVKKKEVNESKYILKSRNYFMRKEIERQSICLMNCWIKNSFFRERVKGIDACNNEYYCRPEVFGQCYRFFSNVHVHRTSVVKQLPIEIFKTYHVGEDFLDISDGLRAIDEVILFCNMNRGSRLGHATVLGLDVDKYYDKKKRILLSKQDFVDNINWLFKKAELLNIDLSQYPCCNNLKAECYQIAHEVYQLIQDDFSFTDYYHSWLLRGDNPERYNCDGTIKKEAILKQYDYFQLNSWVKDGYRTKVAGKLYYMYHCNKEVRKRGQELYDFKIVPDYVKLVKEVQKKMQFEIAYRGIFIECNPTSNYLIAQLDSYSEHPIFNFYNDELFNGHDRNCAQINVSINTDDQGVFDTSLENEYALLAYSLEYCHDENGHIYNPNQVYKWIDSVRKMGIQQKFK